MQQFENLFKCCNKNEIITSLAGIGLGTMLGYGILTYKKLPDSEAPIITTNKPEENIEIDLPDLPPIPEKPSNFQPPITVADIFANGTIQTINAIYTVITYGIYYIVIITPVYTVLRYIYSLRGTITNTFNMARDIRDMINGNTQSLNIMRNQIEQGNKTILDNQSKIILDVKDNSTLPEILNIMDKKIEANKFMLKDIQEILKGIDEENKLGEKGEKAPKIEVITNLLTSMKRKGYVFIKPEQYDIQKDIRGSEVKEETTSKFLINENIATENRLLEKLKRNREFDPKIKIDQDKTRKFWIEKFNESQKVGNENEQQEETSLINTEQYNNISEQIITEINNQNISESENELNNIYSEVEKNAEKVKSLYKRILEIREMIAKNTGQIDLKFGKDKLEILYLWYIKLLKIIKKEEPIPDIFGIGDIGNLYNNDKPPKSMYFNFVIKKNGPYYNEILEIEKNYNLLKKEYFFLLEWLFKIATYVQILNKRN